MECFFVYTFCISPDFRNFAIQIITHFSLDEKNNS